MGRKFSLFASKNTQWKRKIYLKLHLMHFKEKIWQFKDVVHQLNALLTFSWLCGQKSAKRTRRLPPGKLTCPTHRAGGEICVLRLAVQRSGERQEKSLSPGITHAVLGFCTGECSARAVPAQRSRGVPRPRRTHPTGAGSPPGRAHPHPTAPREERGTGADWAKRAPSRDSCQYYTALSPK